MRTATSARGPPHAYLRELQPAATIVGSAAPPLHLHLLARTRAGEALTQLQPEPDQQSTCTERRRCALYEKEIKPTQASSTNTTCRRRNPRRSLVTRAATRAATARSALYHRTTWAVLCHHQRRRCSHRTPRLEATAQRRFTNRHRRSGRRLFGITTDAASRHET